MHDLSGLVQGPLSPLPQDGCSCRIAATFQKKSQVNEGFVVVRLQIRLGQSSVRPAPGPPPPDESAPAGHRQVHWDRALA